MVAPGRGEDRVAYGVGERESLWRLGLGSGFLVSSGWGRMDLLPLRLRKKSRGWRRSWTRRGALWSC